LDFFFGMSVLHKTSGINSRRRSISDTCALVVLGMAAAKAGRQSRCPIGCRPSGVLGLVGNDVVLVALFGYMSPVTRDYLHLSE